MRTLQAQTHPLAPSDAFFAHSSAYVYIVNIRLYHSVIALRLRSYLEALVQVLEALVSVSVHQIASPRMPQCFCLRLRYYKLYFTHTHIYLLLPWDVFTWGLNFQTRKEGGGGERVYKGILLNKTNNLFVRAGKGRPSDSQSSPHLSPLACQLGFVTVVLDT
jgi:hypothetical protein